MACARDIELDERSGEINGTTGTTGTTGTIGATTATATRRESCEGHENRPTQPTPFAFDAGCAQKLSMNTEGAINMIIDDSSLQRVQKRPDGRFHVSLQTHCRKKMSSVSNVRDRSTQIQGLDDSVSSGIRAYLHHCQVHRITPTFDHVHNITINMRTRQVHRRIQSQEIKQFQSEARSQLPSTKAVRMWSPNRIRQLTGRLVIELWRCSLNTPFIASNKRPSDTFKPFAAGVLFTMRGGITIGNGHVLVPHSKSIERTLRLTDTVRRGTPAHRVHLQAHKGVNTLQSCINSIVGEEQKLACYATAIEVATELQRQLDASVSDIG